jgi:hypothetical protein
MNNLYKKLNKESDHIRLTADEKRAMRAQIFGAPVQAPVPSKVVVTRSPYVFAFTHRWMTALAALVLVVFAGGSTAFAAQGALPGQPLYGLKTQVLEPVAVALATTPAAKAAVHVAIAQTRVEEAETLAQNGTLTASTSAALAANFESNAQSADAIADSVATSDPAVAVQIKTQLSASSAVGGAVLAALGSQSTNGGDKGTTDALALQVSARANTGGNKNNRGGVSAALAVATAQPKSSGPRAFAVLSASSSDASATSSQGDEPQAETASVQFQTQSTAAQLEQNAQDALAAARNGFAAASSTLDASTTVAVQTSLSGVDALISDGAKALGDSFYDTAVKDFTEALGRSLRLQALLKAQQTLNSHAIAPLLNSDTHAGGDDSSGN